MVNPKDINPFSLPNLPLTDRKQLPSIAGIYFAIANGKVQYIGRSGNINQRWSSHQRYKEISNMSAPHIAYLELSSSNDKLVGEIEKALINWFNPPLNNSPTQTARPRLTVYLNQNVYDRLVARAEEEYRTPANMAEAIISQALEEEDKETLSKPKKEKEQS